MKNRYLIIIIILILITIGFEILVFRSHLGEHPRLEKAIQVCGIFVALLAAVIALSATDPKRSKVRFNIVKPTIDKGSIKTCAEDKLSNDLKKYYKNFPVNSYRVYFKIKNTSGFVLKEPVITFRVPADKQPPYSKLGSSEKISERHFTIATTDTKKDNPIFQVGDKLVLCRRGLPYWNADEDLEFWIRMVLDDGGLEQLNVEISVNCENADGVTKKV